MNAALAVGKGGTWKGLVSVAGTSAASRIAEVGPWYQELPDGGLLKTFNNVANLKTTPLVPIRYDEHGSQWDMFASVWTGTTGAGLPATQTCTDFTSGTAGTGAVGRVDVTTSDWVGSGFLSCGSSAHLYCVEQ